MARSAKGDELIERRGYRVHGRVQGVGFRWWTEREATRLGLAGVVRNLEDGCVEVMVEGPAEVIETFERSLRRGPPLSLVERLESIPCRLPEQVTEFTIDR